VVRAKDVEQPMMDFLRNVISIEWWREMLSTLTLADLEARWELIQQAIANPQQHPMIAMLALAIVLVFFLIVILTLAMWYFARVQKQTETFELLDEEDNVVRTVNKETAEELLASAQGIDTTAKINYGAILIGLVIVIAVSLGFGFSTRTEPFCTACHASPHVDYAEWPLVAAHEDLTCVNCHEPGNALQGVTLNLFPRSAHALYGAFVDLNDPETTNSSAYGTVTQAGCEGCHDSGIFDRALIVNRQDRVTVRISHYEPLEAGMSCTQCHFFTEAQEQRLIQTGMQTCISCHNGTQAAATCITCHTAESPADTIQREMGSVWSRQLIFDRPDASCYGCHNTRSCDACHGTRVPHTPEYMMRVHVPNGDMIHAYDYWRIGDMCYNCHFYGSASGAGPCASCQGEDYLPPAQRYLTPRQEYITEELGGLPGEPRRSPTGISPFSPTPRRQLTPGQRQILQDNNIDLSLP